MHKHVRLIGTTALIAGASSASGTSSADSLRATGVTSCSSRVTQHAAGKSQPSRRCWRAAAREVVRLLPLWAVDADLRRDAAVLHVPVECLIGRHDGNQPPTRDDDDRLLDALHKPVICVERSGRNPWVSEPNGFAGVVVARALSGTP